MKRYGTDLENEYNGIVARIEKRYNFLNEKTNRYDDIIPEYVRNPHKLMITRIKAMEKKYVEQSKQLDAFND